MLILLKELAIIEQLIIVDCALLSSRGICRLDALIIYSMSRCLSDLLFYSKSARIKNKLAIVLE